MTCRCHFLHLDTIHKVSVPGLIPGVTHALVEEVDLFPTLVEAATMHSPDGPTVLAHCADDTQTSRTTALCTEGVSLIPLIRNATTPWPRAAFSQFTRDAQVSGLQVQPVAIQ